jgi:methionyl-tRNA formyltransferase
MNRERIAFFGSPHLARACLEELHRSFEIPLVVTQPDREKGRGRKVSMTPVKSYAARKGLAVYQSRDLGAPLVEALKNNGVTLIIVVAFGRILQEQVISYPKRGSLNLHASLLPKYRGPSPIEAAILAGERETGVTLQHMAAEMDRGELLDSKRVPIENCWTAEDLYSTIIDISPPFLCRSVRDYLDGRLNSMPQDERHASYCSVINKENGLIDWHEDAERIRNKIRAYNLWPVAYTYLEGGQLKIFNAHRVEAPPGIETGDAPGQVVSADKREGIIVQTGSGYLSITDLQIENRRRMDYREFMNGQKDLAGSILRAP